MSLIYRVEKIKIVIAYKDFCSNKYIFKDTYD